MHDAQDAQRPLALEFRGVSKAFGGTQALDSVDFAVQPGTVHALIGQNGAGKSTLVKILAGFYEPDAGELRLDGERISLPVSAADARANGLGSFHQNITLAPELSILENVRVGRYEPSRLGRIRWRAERERVARMLADVGLGGLDPSRLVADVPPAQRALIGFVRAVQDVWHARMGRGGVLVSTNRRRICPQLRWNSCSWRRASSSTPALPQSS